VRISTGEVIGFEALVRWEYAERGLLLPSKSIPVAEQTGMIVPWGVGCSPRPAAKRVPSESRSLPRLH
jgi:EAL domain-containing protein (putative c-di-GMP-specific phosphodiesterase class I)